MAYLDNAATTPVHPTVREAILPFLNEAYGNPSSLHQWGRTVHASVEEARRAVARAIICAPGDLVFTSGGTEANYAAFMGSWLAVRERRERNHLITSATEHHSVLESCSLLKQFGVEVSFVSPDRDGRIQPEAVLSLMRPETFLVSVMAVNNETGAKSPVAEIAKRVKSVDQRVMVHSDMVQALGSTKLSLDASGLDLATFSGHKVHAPKGVGALFVRHGRPWVRALPGGSQERKRRAGTENVMGIVGFGVAASLLTGEKLMEHLSHLRRLKTRFVEGIADLEDYRLNSPQDASDAILNLSFPGIRSDTLLMRLDLAGIAASAGSACTAGSLEPSHVLMACGQTRAEASESVRFSFSSLTTSEDIDEALRVLHFIVSDLRSRRKN